MIGAKRKCKLLLSILFLSSFYSMSNAWGSSKKSIEPQEKIKNGLGIMEYLFDSYPEYTYLVKYRKDGQFLGVLLMDDEKVGHVLQVYDICTGENVFEYKKEDKEILNFKFKKNAVVIFYKSALWEEKVAYDLYSGRMVRRYSTWFGYN